MNLLIVAIPAAIAIFVATTMMIVMIQDRSAVNTRLAELGGNVTATDSSDGSSATSIFSALTRPLSPIRDLLAGRDGELGYRLMLAGYRKPEHLERFLTIKLLAPIVGIVAATFVGGKNSIVLAIVLGALGYFVPEVLVTRAITKRKDILQMGLPDAIDFLVICMEAGLGMDQALLRVGQELHDSYPALSEELLTISREQSAGKPRLEAWRSMADRVDLDMIRQLITMLTQTERFGTPIAKALGVFADGLRARRILQAEEMAAKTTVKLIFPLIFFIFPSIFIVLLGPAVISMMRSMAVQ